MNVATDRRYLLRVLGLSAVPRVFTFGLTLISFPLMMRALGARQYGIAIFVSALVQILDSCVDMGVSSAAGKNVAAARETRPASVYAELLQWARLQVLIAFLGLAPLFAIAYVFSLQSASIDISLRLLVVSVLSLWVNSFLNFTRTTLTSLVAFKSLALLDTFESVMRSASYLVVAYAVPTAVGLAAVTLLTGTTASALGIAFLAYQMRTVHRPLAEADTATERRAARHPLGYMMKESVSFLWLRVATRSFQSIPLVVFGRQFGPELVGVVGAFARVVEMASLPFAVIGNALAVRSAGVVAKGSVAVRALWDAVSRFVGIAVVLSATMYFVAGILAHVLVRGAPGAQTLLAILSVTVITTAISSIVAPMSDYVGALRSRSILLTAATLLQAPVIWLGSVTFGDMGAVGAYVLLLILMNIGYLRIALRVFFPTSGYGLRREVRYLFGVITVAFLGTVLVAKLPFSLLFRGMQVYGVPLMPVLVMWVGVAAGVLVNRDARRYFLSSHFYDFEFTGTAAELMKA